MPRARGPEGTDLFGTRHLEKQRRKENGKRPIRRLWTSL